MSKLYVKVSDKLCWFRNNEQSRNMYSYLYKGEERDEINGLFCEIYHYREMQGWIYFKD